MDTREPTDSPESPDQGRKIAELVACLRDRKPSAGALLEQLFWLPLTRYCQGHLGTREDAEDAVHDVFCKILALPAAEIPDHFRPWIYRTARNHCLNLARSRRRYQDRVAAFQALAAFQSSGALTRLARQEMFEFVGRALGTLPAQQQEALTLKHVDGLQRDEIAQVLGITTALVKTLLHSGLRELRLQMRAFRSGSQC